MALFDRIKDIIVDQLSADPDDVSPKRRSSTTSAPTRSTWSN